MTRRIVRTPGVMSGRPCIRSTRIPPSAPWSFWRRAGGGDAGITAASNAYPRLSRQDVEAAIRYCERRRHLWALRERLAEWIDRGADALVQRVRP